MATSKQRLALAIIDFLNTSTTDGTLGSDEKESIEVATQCIADAFKVDPSDKAALTDALGGQSLVAIYSVFEKMKTKTAPTKPAGSAPSPAAGPKQPSDAEKAEAESLKSEGNQAMSKKDYKTAIDFYTKALAIIPNNPIYLSNRAAAYSNIGDYDSAIKDAEIAVDTDPSYSKAWSRLGHARYSKGDNRGAMEAYKAGIEAEGNGGTPLLKVGYETAKKKVEQEEQANSARSASPGSPDLGGMGGLPDLGALGGGGLDELLKNPMINSAMEKLKQNPKMMEDLMNSDMLKNMLGGGGPGGSGGLPDFGAMMNNPALAAMAQSFLGGGAGGAGSPRPGAGSPAP